MKGGNNMYMTDDTGREVDVPTLCDVYDCKECPRYMDDCDGNDSVCEDEYTVVWYDEDKRERCTETVCDLDGAKTLADERNGHVYNADNISVYPEKEEYISYDDLRAINEVLTKHARAALTALAGA